MVHFFGPKVGLGFPAFERSFTNERKHMSTATEIARVINGVDVAKVEKLAQGCVNNPHNAAVRFAVSTKWTGGTTSTSRVAGYELAGQRIARSFAIVSDEPHELCGSNTAPNPQELLMSSLASCMMVGVVANASLMGVNLDSVVIETAGQLGLSISDVRVISATVPQTQCGTP